MPEQGKRLYRGTEAHVRRSPERWKCSPRRIFVLWIGLAVCSVQAEGAAPTRPIGAGDSLSMTLEKADSGMVRWLRGTCVDAMEQIQGFFGMPFAGRVRVRVFPGRQALTAYWRSAWGVSDLQPECWQVASGTASMLALLSPRVWKTEACEHDPADSVATKLLITHELVHVFHGQRNPRPEFEGMDELSWFVEGLATYVSGQLDRLHAKAARSAIDAGAGPSSLATAWSGKYRYGVAGSLVKFLDRTYGRTVLVSLLPLTTQQEILRTLGVDERGLLEGWRRWVLQQDGG